MDGATLDATVDALAVSGVTLELVVIVFLSAERAGGGARREGERAGECECERGEREDDGRGQCECECE